MNVSLNYGFACPASWRLSWPNRDRSPALHSLALSLFISLHVHFAKYDDEWLTDWVCEWDYSPIPPKQYRKSSTSRPSTLRALERYLATPRKRLWLLSLLSPSRAGSVESLLRILYCCLFWKARRRAKGRGEAGGPVGGEVLANGGRGVWKWSGLGFWCLDQ
jgi:hypothetical protein